MLGNNKNSNFVQFVVFGKYDFTAEECDEITFKRGDPILVLEKDDEHKDGWWKGKTVDKTVGLFPVEFTTFINIKQINVDGLFDEMEGPASNENINEPSKINDGSSSNNVSIPDEEHHNLSEINTPRLNDQSVILNNSPNHYNGRMNYGNVSGIENMSQQSIQPPPHLVGNMSMSMNNSNDFHSIPPTSWTVDNVLEWLEEIGFGACGEAFKKNNIDGPKLLDQNLGTLRELGISQLKDRLKLFNLIVTLKEKYTQILQETEMNTSVMYNEPSQILSPQHSRLYEDQYIIEEEGEDDIENSIINDSVSFSSSRNDFANTSMMDNRNNIRQINGPAGMRPRLNSAVSRESMNISNTNFNYYLSAQRAQRPPSTTSKSSISSISSFFRRLSLSKPSKKHETVFEPMFQQADYQGWLWTRFNKNSKWKKRWVILSKEKLYFLKEPKHPVVIKDTIQLNITISIQPDIHKGKTKYTFNLIDSANQQITYFSADNHLVMMTWINVLVRATTNAATRLAPCPEGKSPIIQTPNIVVHPAVQSATLPHSFGVGPHNPHNPLNNPHVLPSPVHHYPIQQQQPLQQNRFPRQSYIQPLQQNPSPRQSFIQPLQQNPSPRQSFIQPIQSNHSPRQSFIQQPSLPMQSPHQSFIQSPRNSQMMTPRIQQTKYSPHNLPTQVRRSSMVPASHSQSIPLSPRPVVTSVQTITPTTTPNTSIILEEKEE